MFLLFKIKIIKSKLFFFRSMLFILKKFLCIYVMKNFEFEIFKVFSSLEDNNILKGILRGG